MINPTKVVPKRKGLVIIKKKRPEEQEVKIVKEDFEVIHYDDVYNVFTKIKK